MEEKEISYQGYTIRIVPQEKTGDNTKMFFRILKNEENAFVLWIKISGTSSRKMTQQDVYQYLEKTGLKHIYGIIDKENYKIGDTFKINE